jgi:hypothetical protein
VVSVRGYLLHQDDLSDGIICIVRDADMNLGHPQIAHPLFNPSGDRGDRFSLRIIEDLDLGPADPLSPPCAQGLEDGLFDPKPSGQVGIGIQPCEAVALLEGCEDSV